MLVAELLQIFVDNIVPTLAVVTVAYLVGRRGHIDPKPLGKVLFNIFSPALVFYSLVTTSVTLAELGQLLLVMTLFVGIVVSIAYGVARWQARGRLERAGLMLAAACPNDGNFGLPLLSFAFSEDVLARGVLIFIIMTFLNYSSGIFIASSGTRPPLQAVVSILRVPAIYAALLALVIKVSGLEIPPVLMRPIDLLRGGTVPSMLVLLGLQLAFSSRLTHLRLAGVGASLRLLVSPLVALALVALFNIQWPTSAAVIMQASMPVAVATIIFATEFGLDEGQVSSTILVSTLLSPLTLSVLIWWLRQFQTG